MSDSWKSEIQRAKRGFSAAVRRKSLPPRPVPYFPQATTSQIPQFPHIQLASLSTTPNYPPNTSAPIPVPHIFATVAPPTITSTTSSVPFATPHHPPNASAPIPIPQTSTTAAPPAITATASSVPLGTPKLLDDDNEYLAIGGFPITPHSSLAGGSQTKEVESTAYTGLTETVKGLYNCSDMFLPLKTAAGLFLAISRIVDTVSDNKLQLEELERKLKAILSIVQKYKEHNGILALKHRIETFCKAIVLQMDAVQDLRNHPIWTRIAEGTKDADKIVKAFRTMITLCDVFQMDTALDTNVIVEDTLQRLKSSTINKLKHESTSYKTRHSSYGDPSGCMEGTRVNILANLEAWASDDDSLKVYWMVGMAGTGKSTISQTFCEILDGKNMLAASFFCSRASEKTNNARLIIPTIAHELAKASPSIKAEIVMAIDDDEKLAEATYMNLEDQFKKLVYQPIRTSIGQTVKTYKVVVIDAVDECTDLRLVSSLIRLIFAFVPGTPLKVFIASRDEAPIRKAFKSGSGIRQDFYLHDVEKDVVKNDIHKYLKTSLANIKDSHGDDTSDEWPSQSELDALLERSGTLFIYAATAVRYIADGGDLYMSRLSEMASRGLESINEFETDIDGLYGHVLKKACEGKRTHEIGPMRELVSIIVFLLIPLPVEVIGSLLQMKTTQLSAYLSPLASVIHIPVETNSTVAPFHASFPDFLVDPARCSPERCPRFKALDASDGHTMLALRCLEHMNCFLKFNICDVPEQLTVCRRKTTNSRGNIDKISGALKYACLHWISHLAEVRVSSTDLVNALHIFLHKHLPHWIECVSVLGELRTVLKLLGTVTTTLSHFKMADIRWNAIRLLVEDARRCVQTNVEVLQKNCFEIYRSSLVWIPKRSPIRKVYAKDVSQVPKVILGLSNWWGPTELVLQSGSVVKSTAFSPDGSRIVSGSDDGIVRIWNTTTGEVEAKLNGHIKSVISVAFSQDGRRLVSGSADQNICIWNATTGGLEARLIGHTRSVMSVAFSQDGSRVISGSADCTVRIWNATTGKVEAKLFDHSNWVTSVAFSLDGDRFISGSSDRTAQIWNAVTGEVEVVLKGHADSVKSVSFSLDGSRVVSGSDDATVRIWNARTGEVEAELEGHMKSVRSVAFSSDSSRIVSGSDDETIRIWNVMTGEVEVELEGHTKSVRSVAFSPDGSRVISGSTDCTIRIWNTTRGELEAELKGHPCLVASIALSLDDNRVVSRSDDERVRIREATTGEVDAVLKGHTDSVRSIAFSPDGSRVVSGSDDATVRIWSTTTGELEAELEGHTKSARSVAFSPDGSRVVSGSDDGTILIWNTTTGEIEVELEGHMYSVRSVGFSQMAGESSLAQQTRRYGSGT